MAQKVHCLVVFIAPVFVWKPVAILLSVIKIKHRSHRIHTKSVDVELFNPEKRIGNKEILHFFLSIVENIRSPVRMFATTAVTVFIHCLSIEISETMCIFRKMRRNPVKNYLDAAFVHFIDKIHKVFRRSVTARRCIIAAYLITP